ncbi:hypothetical protein [Grimontia hollisae]|uniref:hypothetical protein n=1 Tax=Grimontia hollisae TaxID=673 RepID=UPI001303E0B4|nr:hypothetical protein [Grimontia hollisae]
MIKKSFAILLLSLAVVGCNSGSDSSGGSGGNGLDGDTVVTHHVNFYLDAKNPEDCYMCGFVLADAQNNASYLYVGKDNFSSTYTSAGPFELTPFVCEASTCPSDYIHERMVRIDNFSLSTLIEETTLPDNFCIAVEFDAKEKSISAIYFGDSKVGKCLVADGAESIYSKITY